jgi:hypothetical protein
MDPAAMADMIGRSRVLSGLTGPRSSRFVDITEKAC